MSETEPRFATAVAIGCTRRQQSWAWQGSGLLDALAGVELVGTPGIDEIGAEGWERLARLVEGGRVRSEPAPAWVSPCARLWWSSWLSTGSC